MSSTSNPTTCLALAIGAGHLDSQGNWLDVFYPAPLAKPGAALLAAVDTCLGSPSGNSHTTLNSPQLLALAAALDQVPGADAQAQADICRSLAGTRANPVLCLLRSDSAISSTPEAYLKLHLLSHRLALPNSLVLDGIFAQLPNVAWTSEGPVAPADLPARQLAARAAGRHLRVHGVDKFPAMTDYVVPSGVRIADSTRIRLGAYLGEGTTVMHEGFINFNAGAEGPNMVEGRISQGVMVGSGTDLGGSCSTIGTLSGGGNIIISIGRECLIGANAGTGIALGDRCTIAAGLFITAGTPVDVLDETGATVSTVKARELSGHSDMLFLRNDRNGKVQCRTNRNAIALNEQLHAHN